MGVCSSTPKGDARTADLDRYLEKEGQKEKLVFKVLLLGAGESGKSTVVKQLKLLHKIAPDDVEIQNYATSIHKNTVQCMQVFIEAAENFGYKFVEEEYMNMVEEVKNYEFGYGEKRMPKEIALYIHNLWRHKSIQDAYVRRAEFWFLDASEYYFENILRFASEDFVPTDEDCIMTRVRTTGISLTEFDEVGVHFTVVDVGGQRNERKKWMHCFDDVKALLFVVNLAGYNQVMYEDPTQNRMHEALFLFGQICNNPVFANTPIFIFLNKKDLFEKEIRTTHLDKCFPEFEGEMTTANALQFIQEKFQLKLKDTSKKLHANYIAARYKKDIKYAWEEVKEILLEENRKELSKANKKLRKIDARESKERSRMGS